MCNLTVYISLAQQHTIIHITFSSVIHCMLDRSEAETFKKNLIQVVIDAGLLEQYYYNSAHVYL